MRTLLFICLLAALATGCTKDRQERVRFGTDGEYYRVEWNSTGGSGSAVRRGYAEQELYVDQGSTVTVNICRLPTDTVYDGGGNIIDITEWNPAHYGAWIWTNGDPVANAGASCGGDQEECSSMSYGIPKRK